MIWYVAVAERKYLKLSGLLHQLPEWNLLQIDTDTQWLGGHFKRATCYVSLPVTNCLPHFWLGFSNRSANRDWNCSFFQCSELQFNSIFYLEQTFSSSFPSFHDKGRKRKKEMTMRQKQIKKYWLKEGEMEERKERIRQLLIKGSNIRK